jgi:glyoxylase-like metal-dependent hydrolase (beta-lactamase superfamily II)
VPDKTEVSPGELKELLDTGRVDFIFDLRNEEEFEAWRIEGRSDIEELNIPQTRFVGEEENYLDRFPKNRRIAAVCAHGDSSKYSAELLRSKGLSAISLKGGMDAWSEYYETHKAGDKPLIYQTYRVARGCISYLIASGAEAVVIDATRHTDLIIKLADRLRVTVTHVFDTHLQADHISGGRLIAGGAGASYHINPMDVEGAAYDFEPLMDGETIRFGDCTLDVVHTPGHTPGSTSLLLNGHFLFTGDTIMKTTIGRPDLGNKALEWSHLLHATLFQRLSGFADGLVVLPTHAASTREQDNKGIVLTTLGAARKGIDLFGIKESAAFDTYVMSSLPQNPERYQEIRKVNLGLLEPDETEKKELEIGKNLCGMAKGVPA